MSDSNEDVKLKFNLKLTGTATMNLVTGEIDWGTTRFHGSVIPVWKESENPVFPEPVKETKRNGDAFIKRIGKLFEDETGITAPSSVKSNTFVHQWRNPMLRILRQVWATAGYNPDARKASFTNYKYGNAALGAMKRVVIDAINHMKASKLSIYSPASIEKVAVAKAAETNYIQLTVEENRKAGRLLELPSQ